MHFVRILWGFGLKQSLFTFVKFFYDDINSRQIKIGRSVADNWLVTDNRSADELLLVLSWKVENTSK